MYKLATGGVIKIGGGFIPESETNADWREYQAWLALGNTPLPADIPDTVREAEIEGAGPTARAFFAANPAAVAFIRLTPAEQAAQIDLMTLAQLRTVVKYLTVAVAVLIKRELL